MSAGVDESMLRELAEPLVAQFSPAERGELFGLLSEAHFAEPEAYTNPDQSGGPLAFGIPELTVLLTPVILAAMNEAARYAARAAVTRGARASAAGLRRLFGRSRPQDAPPEEERLELTPAEWAEIRRIVERVAARGGVSDDQAKLIADAVVGQGLSGYSRPPGG